MRRSVAYTAVITILSVASVFAQERSDSLAELHRRIEILAEEIQRLKTGDVTTPLEPLERGLGPGASRVYTSATGSVSLSSYGEAVYQNFHESRDDGSASGKKDQLDYLRAVLYVGHRFNEWLLFNSELEFEHGSTGKGGEVSVELAYLELLFSRAANLRAGLILVPVGIINEKHEPTTFFGTARPRVEQVIIPSTWRALGVGSYGEITPWLNYRAYIVEGLSAAGFSGANGLRGGRQSGARAVAEEFALTGRIEVRPIPELTIAGDLYAGNSGQGLADSVGVIDAPTRVWSSHAILVWNQLEVRLLHATATIDQAGRISAIVGSPVGERMAGWYFSVGYDVIPLLSATSSHALSPYFIYEKYDTHDRVPEGSQRNPAYDGSAISVGLLYQPYPGVAFKAEYRDNRDRAGSGVNQWNMAINYLF